MVLTQKNSQRTSRRKPSRIMSIWDDQVNGVSVCRVFNRPVGKLTPWSCIDKHGFQQVWATLGQVGDVDVAGGADTWPDKKRKKLKAGA